MSSYNKVGLLWDRWHAVASWIWDDQDENVWDMSVWGACNHAFHLHCILKWVNSQTSQAHCPMCRREWQFKEGLS
ncbi:hypothetical protein BRARA_C03124 [Brassica rapa]|uniref:Anaphase-promoting complex subunit 11 n=1 Tax=Brassica campestris TaxID=3711 RepID=A0A398A014_BRACM|nr:hypothetical protein BRARA_C03124 [Brassica rapa]